MKKLPLKGEYFVRLVAAPKCMPKFPYECSWNALGFPETSSWKGGLCLGLENVSPYFGGVAEEGDFLIWAEEWIRLCDSTRIP